MNARRDGPRSGGGLWHRVRAAVSRAWAATTGTSAAASIGFALLVAGTVFISVVIPRASLTARDKALSDALAAAPAIGKSIVGTTDYETFSSSLKRPNDLTAPDIAMGGRDLVANLQRQQLRLRTPAAWRGLSTGFTDVAGAAARAYVAGLPPMLQFLYRDPLSRYARLTRGHLPAGPPPKSSNSGHLMLRVAVSTATAARFGLRPGSRLTFAGATVLVTGIVQPVDPGSPFWTVNPVAAAPAFVPPAGVSPGYWEGAAFIAPADVPLLPNLLATNPMQLMWYFPLSTAGLTIAGVPVLQSRLSGAISSAGLLQKGFAVATPVQLSTGLTAVLAAFSSEDQALQNVLSLLFVSLAAIGVVVILLAAGLVASRRSTEFAVLRARGAALRQVADRALLSAAALTVPAVVAAVALATALAPGATPPVTWWLAGSALVAALAGLPLIAVGRLRGAERRDEKRRLGRGSARRAAAARRLVVEGSLVVAAVGGIIVLRRQGLTPGTLDVYSSAAPVLVAVLAAIVVVRCYPLVLRLLLRIAGARPGVSAFVGLASATRTSLAVILPVFALVLALAVVAFGTMISEAVHRGEVAASWRQVGADAIVYGPGAFEALSAPAQREIAAVPGVAAAATVASTAGVLAPDTPVTVVVVSPTRYAAVMAGVPGAAPVRAASLARPAGSAGSGALVPVLASPSIAASLPAGRAKLGIGSRSLVVRVTGRIGRIPGLAAGRSVVLLPSWAISARGLPSFMLIVGPQLDGSALTATIRRTVPHAVVILRSHVLATLASAPLPHGADVSITEAAAAAAAFSALVLLLTLLMTARSRDFTLARLSTMGLGRGQARRLAALEMLPQVLAATVGGVACAIALAPLVGPSINLESFTGTGASVPIRTEPLPLAACAVGLVLLAVVALAAQIVISGQRGTARALRIGD